MQTETAVWDAVNLMPNDPCKTCGKVTTQFDKGNGEKFIGCYRCQEPEERCTCND